MPSGNYFTTPITISLGGLRSGSCHKVSDGFNQCGGIEVNSNYINNVNGTHTIAENITDIGDQNNTSYCAWTSYISSCGDGDEDAKRNYSQWSKQASICDI